MKVNFTKKQYKQLLDLAYLGEWTANSTRLEGDRHEEYDEVFQYILSFSKEFGYDDMVIFDKSIGKYYMTHEYEESLNPIINDNDNEVFWSELSSRLAKKELDNSGEVFTTPDDRLHRFWEIEEKYEDEFLTNGLKNLIVQKNK